MWRLGGIAAGVFSFAVLTVPLSAASAQAQDWPNRPVRIVSAFAAGGAADIVARTLADHLSNVFKQQFFVEARPGASGTLAVQMVVNSPPDGYNFVVTTSTLLVLLPASKPKLGYDPVKSLTNIAYIAGTPIVLSVSGKSDVKSLKDFIALGKSPAKPLTYSSSGLGSSGHLVAEVLAQQAGIKIEHVPYKGGAQGLADLVGGHITFGAQTLPSTAQYMKSGTLTAIAHSAKERVAEFPRRADAQGRGLRHRQHHLVLAVGTGGTARRPRAEDQPRGHRRHDHARGTEAVEAERTDQRGDGRRRVPQVHR